MITTKTRFIAKIKKHIFSYYLVAPLLIFLGVVLFYPILHTIFLSFTSIRLVGSKEFHFVGLENYIVFCKGPHFWSVLRNTIVYTFFVVVGSYFIGLGLAVLMNINLPGQKFFRIIFLVPWGIPVVAASLIWIYMMNYQTGVLNFLLESIGLQPVNWLGSTNYAMLSVLLVRWWITVPLTSMVLFGGLQTVPKSIIEAARIDGATNSQVFWYVIMPILKPISAVLILLLTIWASNDFSLIFILTEGGPAMATTNITLETYFSAFKYIDFGRAAAVAGISLLWSGCFSVLYLKQLFGK